MSKITTITALLIFGFFLNGCKAQSGSESNRSTDLRLLIFSKTEGFRHASIPDGVEALQKLAQENGWEAGHTEDASMFNADSLKNYSAVIFLSTTGDVLNERQQSEFEQYIQNGGGFVGIHAASDTEYEWPWYGKLVGAYFVGHPEVQQASLTVIDSTHASTTFLPQPWVRTDEWYNFKDINPDINVLMNLDESTYEGGKNGENHPAAWYHAYDGGRSFYTVCGHTSESYSEELFLQHLWGGIKYAVAGGSQ